MEEEWVDDEWIVDGGGWRKMSYDAVVGGSCFVGSNHHWILDVTIVGRYRIKRSVLCDAVGRAAYLLDLSRNYYRYLTALSGSVFSGAFACASNYCHGS